MAIVDVGSDDDGSAGDGCDRRCMPPLRRPWWWRAKRCYRVLRVNGCTYTRKTDAEITSEYRPIPAVRYMRFTVLLSCNIIQYIYIYIYIYMYVCIYIYIYIYNSLFLLSYLKSEIIGCWMVIFDWILFGLGLRKPK